MFEVNVKNVTEEEGREGRRGPARVWGSDGMQKAANMSKRVAIN